VASFLLSLSDRLQRRGLAAHTFILPMARQDIANYLGLATETISRIFSQLQADNIVTSTRRQLHINNFRQLQLIACE
jgi:CRP/FNR family transcriptional regulator